MTNTTMIDITPIIEAILGLVITIFTVIVAPKLNAWVKNKKSFVPIEKRFE